jgi:signal peptidase II
MSFLKNQWFWIVAAASLLLDVVTKYGVIKSLAIGQSWPLWPGVFHFTHAVNRGAAFSLFQGEGWLRWLSLIVSVGLMGWALFGPRLQRLEQLAYGAILAGALGNGVERFTLGYVTDFIDVRLINFAIFNWADVSINIGIFTYLLHTFLLTQNISDRKH